MNLQEAAQAALDVQDACNLSGVARSFAEVMQALSSHAWEHKLGTAWKNEHPVARLFISKMADLCGLGEGALAHDRYHDAYTECQQLAKAEPVLQNKTQ